MPEVLLDITVRHPNAAYCKPGASQTPGHATAKAEAAGLDGNAVTLAAGQDTLGKILIFPIVLTVAFGILFAVRKTFAKEVAHD